MIASLISILIGAAIFFLDVKGSDLHIGEYSNVFILISSLVWISLPLTYAFAWSPLQREEQNVTPRLFELFAKDGKIKWLSSALFLFPIFTFGLVLLSRYVSDSNQKYLLISWIILLGVMSDLFFSYLRRVTHFMNPFQAVDIFADEAKKSIRKNNIENVVDSIDSLSEVAIRSINRSNTSLAIDSIQKLRDVGTLFLKSASNLTNLDQDLKSLQEKHEDKVSFTIFYLLNRLEMINSQAAHKKLEPVCTSVISTLGRLAISVSKYDLNLSVYPIMALGRAALKDLNENWKDIGLKSLVVLQEVGKTILSEVDVTYLELNNLFLTLINNLELIAKELFVQDKSIDIKYLTQPFLDLKDLFGTEPLSKHTDSPVITGELNRVLAEFSTLETVMRTKPPISQISDISNESDG